MIKVPLLVSRNRAKSGALKGDVEKGYYQHTTWNLVIVNTVRNQKFKKDIDIKIKMFHYLSGFVYNQ